MNEFEKIDFAGGEINALFCMVAALVNTHPNPQALDKEFDRLSELQQSETLPARVTEHFLQGQTQRHSDMKNLIFRAIAIQLGAKRG